MRPGWHLLGEVIVEVGRGYEIPESGEFPQGKAVIGREGTVL
jgi:hypothetical protein